LIRFKNTAASVLADDNHVTKTAYKTKDKAIIQAALDIAKKRQ
jgi:hypothetical protein